MQLNKQGIVVEVLGDCYRRWGSLAKLYSLLNAAELIQRILMLLREEEEEGNTCALEQES